MSNDDVMDDPDDYTNDPGVISGDPSRARIPAETKCIINPRSTFQSRWDLFIVLLLLFTAIVTPWEVAFLTPAWNWLYFVNRFVDIGFLCDLICQFFTPYYSQFYMGFVIDHKRIAKNYASGWFSIDLISIFPFDTLGLVMESESGGGSGGLGQLKILRVIRLARLAKLLKVMKSSAIFKKWESRIGMQFSTLTMIKWGTIISFLCHWLACAWHTVISIEEVIERGQEVSWRKTYNLGVTTPFERYLTSLYWAVMTCTTIGYGDIAPQTNGERMVAIVGMMIGSSAYAYVVGNICGVIATMDQASTEFNQSMDDLNLYMEENHVPTELRIRLREYFMYAKAMNRQEYYSKLYEKMSPSLRGEVAYHINQEWISNVPFLSQQPGIGKEEHQLFITDIAMALKAEAYGPQEVIIKLGEKAEKMYIMQKGVVAKGGNIISGGNYFGADIILAAGRRTYMVRALTFCDLFVLRKDLLERILDSANYYGVAAQIRRASLCESFKMSFIRLAHIKAGISNSQYVAAETLPGARPTSAGPNRASGGSGNRRGGAGKKGSSPMRGGGPEIIEEGQHEVHMSQKAQQNNQIVPQSPTMIQSPQPQQRSRKQRGGNNNGGGGGNYSRSKPPRILEMLGSRHDELVQAIRGLAQRNDRRSDSIEERLNKMSGNTTMGLAIMCVLLAGMVVGLLITQVR